MFEIRVAVIGYVSVGKTTVINALFGNEYGEVSMRRTTAVVNSFRISSPAAPGGIVVGESEDSPSEDDSEGDSIGVIAKRFTAKATLEETKADNAVYRTWNVVSEKTFDICLQEPIHEMRSDTKLVVVDIPGINEVGTSSKYKDYVNDHWHTFDIVVVVMDARQGVNTEEQHNLLRLVKNNTAQTKDVPVIILCNKVDDPHNKEQQLLLDEARRAVSNIFGVNDRTLALKRMLDRQKGKTKPDSSSFPAVIPIGAMHAFVYRCGSRLSFDEFCKMDAEFIENLGKESYGRQWHRFNKKKKLEKAFESVSEEEQRLDGIRASNFDAFTKVLSYAIGDKERQKSLIRFQAEIAVERLKEGRGEYGLGDELLSAHNKLDALGESTDFLTNAFWTAFRQLKKTALESFPKDFSPAAFSKPTKQLLNYQKALEILPFDNELEKVVTEAKGLALLYAVTVMNADKMKNLSQSDVHSVVGSMLLCSGETTFSLHFGQLKLWLESQYRLPRTNADKQCDNCFRATSFNQSYKYDECTACNRLFVDSDTTNCPACSRNGYHGYPLTFRKQKPNRKTGTCNSSCRRTFHVMYNSSWSGEMKVENGRLIPVDPVSYKLAHTIQVPASLEDPNHFGHVVWMCCKLLKTADAL